MKPLAILAALGAVALTLWTYDHVLWYRRGFKRVGRSV